MGQLGKLASAVAVGQVVLVKRLHVPKTFLQRMDNCTRHCRNAVFVAFPLADGDLAAMDVRFFRSSTVMANPQNLNQAIVKPGRGIVGEQAEWLFRSKKGVFKAAVPTEERFGTGVFVAHQSGPVVHVD